MAEGGAGARVAFWMLMVSLQWSSLSSLALRSGVRLRWRSVRSPLSSSARFLWWGSSEGASARLAQAVTVMNWPLMSRGILMEGVLSPSSCAMAHDGRDRTKRRAKAERRGARRDNDEPRSELVHGRDAVWWGFDAQ